MADRPSRISMGGAASIHGEHAWRVSIQNAVMRFDGELSEY
jgi:hypothetical protein